jgi:hypothetical protein
MMKDLLIKFVWIPSSLGGHSGPPFEGMRTSIRWQKHLIENSQCMRDVQWSQIEFDVSNGHGTAICKLAPDTILPADWVREGELIELVNGYRVLAVGVICQS